MRRYTKRLFPVYGILSIVLVSLLTGCNNEADTIVKGGSMQFNAGVKGKINPSGKVEWSITAESKAEGTNIDENGVLTVALDEQSAELTIKAVSVVDPSKSGEKTVKVDGTATVTCVTVSRDGSQISNNTWKRFTDKISGPVSFLVLAIGVCILILATGRVFCRVFETLCENLTVPPDPEPLGTKSKFLQFKIWCFRIMYFFYVVFRVALCVSIVLPLIILVWKLLGMFK